MTESHHELHECDHDECECFWCRVSRREHFETVTDVMAVAAPLSERAADDEAGGSKSHD